MFVLLRHHRYEVQIGEASHVLRVEELVSGSAVWAGKFRARLPATSTAEAKTVYGPTADVVAHQAAEFLSRESSTS